MSAERLLVWVLAAAIVAVSVAAHGASPALPTVPVAIALGALVALPLAVVFVGWLSTYRGGRRGWS